MAKKRDDSDVLRMTPGRLADAIAREADVLARAGLRLRALAVFVGREPLDDLAGGARELADEAMDLSAQVRVGGVVIVAHADQVERPELPLFEQPQPRAVRGIDERTAEDPAEAEKPAEDRSDEVTRWILPVHNDRDSSALPYEAYDPGTKRVRFTVLAHNIVQAKSFCVAVDPPGWEYTDLKPPRKGRKHLVDPVYDAIAWDKDRPPVPQPNGTMGHSLGALAATAGADPDTMPVVIETDLGKILEAESEADAEEQQETDDAYTRRLDALPTFRVAVCTPEGLELEAGYLKARDEYEATDFARSQHPAGYGLRVRPLAITDDDCPPHAPHVPQFPSDYTADDEHRADRYTRGMPDCPADAGLRNLIARWRERQAVGDTEPRWGEWAEFAVELADGAKVAVTYEPRSFGDHLEFHGPMTGTGYRSYFLRDDDRGGSLAEFAQAAAREVHDESLKAQAKELKRLAREAKAKAKEEVKVERGRKSFARKVRAGDRAAQIRVESQQPMEATP